MWYLDIYSKKSFDVYEDHLMSIHAPKLMHASFAALPANSVIIIISSPGFSSVLPPLAACSV